MDQGPNQTHGEDLLRSTTGTQPHKHRNPKAPVPCGLPVPPNPIPASPRAGISQDGDSFPFSMHTRERHVLPFSGWPCHPSCLPADPICPSVLLHDSSKTQGMGVRC